MLFYTQAYVLLFSIHFVSDSHQWEDIPYSEMNDERPGNPKGYVFNPRTALQFQAATGAQQSTMRNLGGKIAFRIVGPDHEMWTVIGSGSKAMRPVAVTTRGRAPSQRLAFISINSDYVETLLRTVRIPSHTGAKLRVN